MDRRSRRSRGKAEPTEDASEAAAAAQTSISLARVDASCAAVLFVTSLGLLAAQLYVHVAFVEGTAAAPAFYREFHTLTALPDLVAAVACLALAAQTWTGRRALATSSRRVLTGKIPVIAAGMLVARIVLFAQYDARSVLPLGASPYALHVFLDLWCLFAAATAVQRYRVVCAVAFATKPGAATADEPTPAAKAGAAFTARASRLSFVFLLTSLATGAFCLAFKPPLPRPPAETGAEGIAAAMQPTALLCAELLPLLDGFCVLAGVVCARLLRARAGRSSSPSPMPLLASCVGGGAFLQAGLVHIAFFCFAAAADPRLEIAAHLVAPFFLISCSATVIAVQLLASRFVFR